MASAEAATVEPAANAAAAVGVDVVAVAVVQTSSGAADAVDAADVAKASVAEVQYKFLDELMDLNASHHTPAAIDFHLL